MKPYPVIGLTGRARSGKDTVAAILIDTGLARYQYGLADPIRAMLKAGLRIDMDAADWQQRKEEALAHLGVTPRRLMQTLGTEWGRNLVHENVWIGEAQQTLAALGQGMVISDVRFPNEAEWIRKIGGRIIHVHRRDAPPVEAHSSEGGVSFTDNDRLLDNSGTLDELRTKVLALFGRGSP